MDGAGEVSGDHGVGQRQIGPVLLTPSEAAFDRWHPPGPTRTVVLPSQRVHIVATGEQMTEEQDLVRLRGGVVHCTRDPAEERRSGRLVGQGTRPDQSNDPGQPRIFCPEPLELPSQVA